MVQKFRLEQGLRKYCNVFFGSTVINNKALDFLSGMQDKGLNLSRIKFHTDWPTNIGYRPPLLGWQLFTTYIVSQAIFDLWCLKGSNFWLLFMHYCVSVRHQQETNLNFFEGLKHHASIRKAHIFLGSRTKLPPGRQHLQMGSCQLELSPNMLLLT